mmetsp:Transcript_111178/g.254972  ORF Transcript_111178/g.254972 Transcript_111178/m.254972 type:complete len:438 (+) Transcript_111178:355-1668(+)
MLLKQAARSIPGVPPAPTCLDQNEALRESSDGRRGENFQANPLLRDFLQANGYLDDGVDKEAPRRVATAASQAWVEKIVLHKSFEFVFSAIIFANAVVMGLESDGHISDSATSVLDHIFTLGFTVELSMRVAAFRAQFVNDLWNWFDTICVLTSWLDSWILPAFSAGGDDVGNVSVARLFRIFRLFKATRILRVLRIFKELRVLMQGLMDSLRSLCWTLLLLTIIIYVSAVFLTQILRDSLEQDVGGALQIRDLFGSVPLSMFTLFQIMTLDDWAGGIARPMMDISLATVFVFLIYIAFTTFSLLNIVTGVFVDSTSHASKRDEEEMMRCQMAERDSFMADLRSFFETADTDGNGFITYDEFETVLSSSEDVRSHLEQLNIGTREARGLFRILDLDGGGAVSIDEFIFGCLRMKGAAKSTVSRSGSWHHAAGQAWML